MEESHAHLSFSDEELVVSYISHGEVMLRLTFKYGYKFLDATILGGNASSALSTALATLFESVSLYDRIPLHVRVDSVRHREWIKKTIEGLSYTQFYTNDLPFRVTLIDNRQSLPSYARHSQTLQSFKI